MHLGCDAAVWIHTALDLPGVHLVPIEPAIAIDSMRLPGNFHADPADRSSSLRPANCSALLLTADRAILDYAAGGHVRIVDASR